MFRTVLFSALVLIAGPAFSREIFPTGFITADRVNLRSGPALRSEIVGQLSRGQEVAVIASDGQWCAITPPPAISGWVTAKYVKEGVVTGDRVNIRTGPGISYARLGKLRSGARVEVLLQEGRWTEIVLPASVHLWVNARFLSLAGISPPPITPTPTPRPAGTPFRPRMAPAYMPSRALPIREYSGLLEKMDRSRKEMGRSFPYRFDSPGAEAYLTSRTIDLNRYQNRKVRLWVERLGKSENGFSLLDVKGIQILW